MSTHADFHYSITVLTKDLAVLHCLRALSVFAQKEGNKRIPFGGTKESDWQSHHCQVTFHFTAPSYRSCFETEANRLLPQGSWSKVGDSDENPAKPQAARGSWY